MSGLGRDFPRRLGTALVLGTAVIALVLLAPTAWLMLVFSAVIAVGAWEWATLTGLRGPSRLLYVGALVVAGPAIAALEPLVMPVLLLAAAWWCAAVVRLARPAAAPGARPGARALLLCDGAFFVVPAWLALGWLHGQPGGAGLVLVVLVLCWAADTGAYVGGRRFGKRRLAPRISPGKTVEGLYAGAATAGLVAVVAGILPAGYPVPSLALWIGICMLATLFSVAGDLFESRFKRALDAKDSGSMLPGHGGVLDRVDSVAAAAPIFAVAWFAGIGGAA